MYRKIYIVGIVASGKTTLSRELSIFFQVPVYELDSIVHHKTETERYKRTPEAQLIEIERIDRDGSWIFEGVHRPSYESLYDLSELIIFLDPPLHTRYYRILKRWIKQNLKIEKCNYKPNFKMLRMMYKWTNDFEKERDCFEKKLFSYGDKVIVIKNKRDLRVFLKGRERGFYETN